MSFRNITYYKRLYESLRWFYSINSSDEVSILYKILAACLSPLQPAFDAYVIYRQKEFIIAQCKWQIGQLTNVLNFLYDTTLKRIYLTQSVINALADPTFFYAPINFDSDFATAPEQFERGFRDRQSETLVTINVPTSVYSSDLVATVEQIRMQGIPYQITQF